MKFLAVLLLSLVFISSFSDMQKPVEMPAKTMACHKMAGKIACPQNKKHDQKDNCCGKQGCTMLLTCSTCGFLVADLLKVMPQFAWYNAKPVSLYKIGDLSAYHPDDWKPPKV